MSFTWYILTAERQQEGTDHMARYIVLANWTDQGIKNVKDSPARVDAAREMAKSLGALR